MTPPARTLTRWLALLVVAVVGRLASADDVGLVSARLIEQPEGRVILEVDVPPTMLNVLAPPVLPERLRFGAPPQMQRRGPLVNVRYTIDGGPLRTDDVLLLPWIRSGVVMEARWLDGRRRTALLVRRVEGIPVPVAGLRDDARPTATAVREELRRGARTVATSGASWLLVAAVVLLIPARPAAAVMIAWAAGLAAALLLTDVRVPPPMPALTTGLTALAAVLAARAAILTTLADVEGDGPRGTAWSFAPILAIVGATLGLTLAAPSASVTPPVARAAVILGAIGAGALQFGAAVLLRHLVQPAVGSTRRTACAVVLGTVGVTAMLLALSNASESTPEDDAPPAARLRITRAGTTGLGAGGAAPPAPRRMDDPALIFVTVEPLEVRCEVLLAGPVLEPLLEGERDLPPVLAPGDQPALSADVLDRLSAALVIRLDGAIVPPALERADFVTLSAGGAATRPTPVDEALAEAVLGVTLVLPVEEPPDRLTVTWSAWPSAIARVPVTVTDPDGVEGLTLTPESTTMTWTNELIASPGSEIRAVPINRPTWGVATAVLLAGSIVLAWRRRGASGVRGAGVGVLLAVILFPVVRLPTPWQTPLSDEQATEVLDGLLTNVYRAFGSRDESTVYDRLSVSVSGEALATTYLEQQRALELENRGGARARVDEVVVEEVSDVRRVEGGDLEVVAEWTVSGSVSHFGHTHYRRNRYAAVVRLRPSGTSWTIAGIDVLDEDREI